MSNGYDAQDMATQGADGFRNGYQAGYSDAVKAFDAAQPAAAQEAAWNKTKPTAEGAYYVRGFNLFQLAKCEALVQVRTHHFDGEPAPELVCNIHESTSNAEMDDWSPMVDMSGDFEWIGPLVIAPVAAAPVEITGVQLGLAMTAFDAAGGHQLSYAPLWMRKALEAASTPAAPGIDLEQFREAVEHWKRDLHDDYKGGHIHDGGEAMRKAEHLLALIDASPKGVSDATAFYDASAKGFHISETCGPDGKYHAVSKFQTLADLHAFEDARRTLLIAERDRRELQATSAEVVS